jgi:glycosyltransferase involved in cell wall biosynthesis
MQLSGVSAVLPARDEEDNLVPMVESVLAVLPEVARRFELIVVDDGSRDHTPERGGALVRAHPDAVRVVRHERSRGYGAALRSGLAAARLDWIFLTDADRQFDPGGLRACVTLLGDADALVGYRAHRADPPHRRVYAAAWNLLVRHLLRLPVRDVNCAFKLVRRSALEGIELRARGGTVSAELVGSLARRGGRIVEVPVAHFPRPAGTASGSAPCVVARAFLELPGVWWRVRTLPARSSTGRPARALARRG